MTTSLSRGSAKIYEFPARGRFAIAGDTTDTTKKATTLTPSRVGRIAFGSSWYHDEAIQEAERPRKN